MGIFDKIREGLQKTREKVARSIESVFHRRDSRFYQEIEEILVSADVGPVVSKEIVAELQSWEKANPGATSEASLAHLEASLTEIFPKTSPWEEFSSRQAPLVILLVGVNGVGKTTTAGKLASRFKDAGKSVIFGAADTFRAAAIEQLRQWGDRIDVPVVHQKPGADPASVAFDTVRAARARGIDVAIIDTAGRLQNKQNLMSELKKIGSIIGREAPDSPVEVWLVLDATIGQNALSQLDEFMKIAPVSGLILTKLDGTSRGGVVIALARRHPIPIRFIGVGEKADDLLPFDPAAFVRSILRTH